MKNTILIMGMLVLTSFSLKAQDEETSNKNYDTEIGLNVSNFIKSFLSLNTQTIQTSPYFIVAKHKSLRVHLGLKGNDGQNFLDDSNSINNRRDLEFDLKVGFEKRQDVGSHWIFHYGLDLVGSYQYNRLKTNTAIDEIENVTEAAYAGVSPFLGLQFKINKRLKLLTESNWIIAYGRSTEKLQSAFFPNDLNRTNIANFTFTELNPPVDLYLIFSF